MPKASGAVAERSEQRLRQPDQGYTSIPNPDLKPETSESLELGVRWRDVTLFGGDLRASANVFGSWYDDFIDQVQLAAISADDPAVFQFINLARSRDLGR